MSTSNASISDAGDISFRNRKCRCGVRAALRISESHENPGMVYLACPFNNKNNNGCGFFFQWWMPPQMQRQWLKMAREESSEDYNMMSVLREVTTCKAELKEMVAKSMRDNKEMFQKLNKEMPYPLLVLQALPW